MKSVRTLGDGNQLVRSTSAVFFRDEQGRTRLEQGNVVTINDPLSHTMYLLDLSTAVAHKYQQTERIQRVNANAPNKSLNSSDVRTSLGKKEFDGLVAIGEEYVSVTPKDSALGNKQPIKKITRVWRSEEIQLPIVTTIDDPVNGDLTSKYVDIQKNVSLDPSLFQVPANFKVIVELAPKVSDLLPGSTSGGGTFGKQ